MRELINIVENTDWWKRWWVNTSTGKIIPIKNNDHHELYLMNNLSEFDLGYLDKEDDEKSYSDADIDYAMICAYKNNWQAMVYSSNNHQLNFRTIDSPEHLRNCSKIVKTIMTKLPVSYLMLDLYSDFELRDDGEGGQELTISRTAQLEDVQLERFSKTGILPISLE